MFPPPMTMPTCTPISTSSRVSWAICCSVFGEIPYLPSPISASPLSFRRMRLNLGGFPVGAVTGRGSYLALRRWSGSLHCSVCIVGEGFLARRAREPRKHFDPGERLELDVDGAGFELLEPACRRQHPSVERSDRAVVRLEGALERSPELGEVPAQVRDPLVELAPLVGDLARVRCDGLLLPDVGDGEQEGEERGRCGEDDSARKRILVEPRIDLQGGGEKAL